MQLNIHHEINQSRANPIPCHIHLLLENKNSQLFPSPSSPLLCSIMFHVVRGFFYQKRNKKNFSCIDMVSFGQWLIDYLACVTLSPCFGFSSSIPSFLFWNAFLGSVLHYQITVCMSSRLCSLATGVLYLISSLIQFGWLIE